MNIASLNPDSAKSEQMQRDIIKNLTRNKIHIASIQETHIIQDRDYLSDNYRIIASAATKKGGGNRASTRRKSINDKWKYAEIYNTEYQTKQQRTQSNTRPSRLEHAHPDHYHLCAAKWARRRNRRQHWGEVKAILNKTCKRRMIIWRTDANGQIGRDEAGGSHNEKATRNIIGPYTRAKKTEKGIGTHLEKICQRRHMIPMTTWKEPEREKGRWKKCQRQENMTKERWEAEMKDKYLTTWTSPGGETRGQIDYIMINAKYRNTAEKANSDIYRRADMEKNQKYRAHTIQL